MREDRDHYEIYYADKLWSLLPAVYRAEDSASFDTNGPLRELVNRIGAQAAILRRSIDRLWEDQSIETCDDWMIPYIGDLLAARLAGSLDAVGQRRDVAKTIYYRRRKGTVGLLEELAADITGWDARIVEFFRRLGRTRHSLDPALPLPAESPDPNGTRRLLIAEGLRGPLTQTGIGGWADLRNDDGASAAKTAFDEFFYSADVRRGQGQFGWQNIPNIGVFLWRLESFGVDWTTPVPRKDCAGQYTFDPTGREIALFAARLRTGSDAFGANWTPPLEWQMPSPIRKSLLESALRQPADLPLLAITNSVTGKSDLNSLGVFRQPGIDYTAIDAAHLSTQPDRVQADPQGIVLDPERGLLRVLSPPPEDSVFVTYHFGFSSRIGAGPYDRRTVGAFFAPSAPAQSVSGGKDNLKNALAAGINPTDQRILNDSLTYDAMQDITVQENFALRATNGSRPVVRLPETSPEWVITGTGGCELTLDGILFTGGEITLRGAFDTVTIFCGTLDPGDWNGADFTLAADGRKLTPCRLNVDARVKTLIIQRSICGPVVPSANGSIENFLVSDSLLQSFDGENALQMEAGTAFLTRVTLLGPALLNRIEASECIFDEIVTIADIQHGCVRFSACSTGSTLPSPYESVEIAPHAPLFNSRVWGHAAYAQLREDADSAIVTGAAGRTISEGAQNGSEMGAFALEKNPIKTRSLLFKYREFLPLGLTPVIIYAT